MILRWNGTDTSRSKRVVVLVLLVVGSAGIGMGCHAILLILMLVLAAPYERQAALSTGDIAERTRRRSRHCYSEWKYSC